MPKPIKPSRLAKDLRRLGADEDHRQMTVKEVADEIEGIRADAWAVLQRLDKLSWALMTRGVRPGVVRETGDDIPF